MRSDSQALASQNPTPRRATAPKKPFARSRVGNGKTLLADIDQRSISYRQFADIVSDLTQHLGGSPSPVEAAIAEEAAGLIVWCRQARASFLKGEEFDVASYCTATNSLRRLLQDIGQERRLKDVVPDLRTYLAQKAEEAA